ncbi:hypothetical protein GEV33_004521 [Tenebrio molitor]|uniref:CCHC-type domain-containing protein n=1 Tax=Tenebrio molitor TaxID=7067 RepID=A0A8J6LED0_TENMO|nr:hypothetical protein GEV33_004521 [Tenebrio molitor]
MIHGSPKTNPKMERKPLKLNIEKANAESDVAPSTPGPETPTAPGTPVGLHCGCFDLEWDSTSARSTKKRRLDEEDDEEEEREPRRGDRLKVKARELLTELREQVNDLEKMTGAANFPNAELADKVAVIRSMVTNLVTEDVIQRVEGSVEARETTNLCRKCGERVDKEVQPGEIEKVTSFQSFAELAKKEWPETLFYRTRRAHGNPLQAARKSDLAVMVTEEDRKMEKGIARLFAERFPEIGELDETDWEANRVPHIVLSTAVPRKTGGNIVNERYIFRRTLNTQEGESPLEAAYRHLRALNGRISVKLAPARGTAAPKLRKAVLDAMGEMVTAEVVATRQLVMRDLDRTVTENEIRTAIGAVIGPNGMGEQVQISDLKKPQGGMAGMATLHLPDVEADRLLEVGRVRIGWNQCRVQERMVPMRCFQCLRFGHLASRCAAEKRVAAGSCFRCGKEGHLARDCENDPWCHNCGKGNGGNEGEQETSESRSMRFLQLNANRSRAVHWLVDQLTRERGTSVLLMSEPNIRQVRTPGWLVDDSEDAAIMLRGTSMRKWGKGRGFVWAQVTSYTVFSCYISPNITTGEFERHLDDLASCVRTQGGPVIVAGDFNAKAFMWGSAVEDAKGRMLADWAAATNLVAMNRGEPTFERGGSTSVLDVTFCSPDVARRVHGWHVMEAGSTTSDHMPIEFEIAERHIATEAGSRLLHSKFNIGSRKCATEFFQKGGASGIR